MIRTGTISPFDILGEATFMGSLSLVEPKVQRRIQLRYAEALERGTDSLHGCVVVTLTEEELLALRQAWLDYEGYEDATSDPRTGPLES